jgi:hypothetical protein
MDIQNFAVRAKDAPSFSFVTSGGKPATRMRFVPIPAIVMFTMNSSPVGTYFLPVALFPGVVRAHNHSPLVLCRHAS